MHYLSFRCDINYIGTEYSIFVIQNEYIKLIFVL